MIGKLIEENRRDDENVDNEETIKSIAGAVYIAGADTVSVLDIH